MNLVMAMPREAFPLIEHHRLQREANSPYALYCRDGLRLIVTGMGIQRSTLATEYLKKRFPEKNQAWLNLGIAGHGNLDIGKVFVAGTILHTERNEVFYPPQIHDLPTPVSVLTTCPEPKDKYEENMGYDMEAHGFYKAACQASTRELVQVLKIVSDNPVCPLSTFRPKTVNGLIEQNLEEIGRWIEALERASEEIKPSEKVDETFRKLLKQAHFTTTRSHQLHALLRQGRALGVEMSSVEEHCREVACPKRMLVRIEEFIGPRRSLS